MSGTVIAKKIQTEQQEYMVTEWYNLPSTTLVSHNMNNYDTMSHAEIKCS